MTESTQFPVSVKRVSENWLKPGAWLFGSYMLLILCDVIGIGDRRYQSALTALWLVLFATKIARLTTRPTSPFSRGRGHLNSFSVGVLLLLGQLPGLVAAVASFAGVLRGSLNEWANGLLEIWVSPFLFIWELFSFRPVHHLNNVYVEASLTPFAIVLFGTLWSILVRVSSTDK